MVPGHRLPLDLGFLNGFGQQSGVEIKADSGDMAMLPRSQQLPRTPDLQIPHRNAEARPQLCLFADGLQALASHCSQGCDGGV